MVLHKMLTSPKRGHLSENGIMGLYHYYAGFSPEFVKDVLAYLNVDHDMVIFDPWNGSGTTTQVANDMGFSAIGYDINPVMVIVAKAKLLNCTSMVSNEIVDNIGLIIDNVSEIQRISAINVDPLEAWLEPKSASFFRNIQRTLHHKVIGIEYNSLCAQESQKYISVKASFYYLALFKTLREFLLKYVATNPTWIKKPLSEKDRIKLTHEEICKELQCQVHNMINIMSNYNRKDNYSHESLSIKIEQASSESIPLENSSIDIVISSPPYCTRIDYAVATSPELALLGYSMNVDLKNLRDLMIGTPTIINKRYEVRSSWGRSCLTFLKAVEKHNTKASKSYYYKYYVQYFDSIYKSLSEINRTLARSGKCVLVVQDSYFKDIHNDLPEIYSEMANSLDWIELDRFDYKTKRTMAGRNAKAKKYRSDSEATESVLIFEKL